MASRPPALQRPIPAPERVARRLVAEGDRVVLADRDDTLDHSGQHRAQLREVAGAQVLGDARHGRQRHRESARQEEPEREREQEPERGAEHDRPTDPGELLAHHAQRPGDAHEPDQDAVTVAERVRHVQHLEAHREAVATADAVGLVQRGQHLGAPSVVVHARRVLVRVPDHGAVGADPRHPDPGGLSQLLELVTRHSAAPVRERLARQRRE